MKLFNWMLRFFYKDKIFIITFENQEPIEEVFRTPFELYWYIQGLNEYKLKHKQFNLVPKYTISFKF